MISPAACDRIHDAIENGIKEGAELLVDGRHPKNTPAGGNFVGPTILNKVKPDMSAARDEIFGPVLSVMHVDSLDEAIALVVSKIRLGFVSPWLFANHPMGSPEPPEGYVWSLPLLYLVWGITILLLYFPCQWFAGVKAKSTNWWLKYL